MDQRFSSQVNPWLLSKILDKKFVGSEEGVNIKRKKYDMLNYISLTDYIKYSILDQTSSSEGFLKTMCVDEDYIIIDRNVIVMNPDLYQCTSLNRNYTVLLMTTDHCQPGCVALQVAQMGYINHKYLQNSIFRIYGSKYVYSTVFRENHVKDLKNVLQYKPLFDGPCSSFRTPTISRLDITVAFPCVSWPSDAREWVNRTRVFGWPTKTMIRKIVKDGCHVVPMGQTLLEWRLLFTTAERHLMYSINHIQFKVYGLLKYIVDQIKDRLRQGVGDERILNSHVLKTLIFYALENSPQSLWQEKNIFVCFWFSFTMLLDWVNVGFFPDYFVPTCNILQQRVQDGNERKLFEILLGVYRMKWKSLSIGTVYRPSIWELLCAYNHEALTNLQVSQSDFESENELFRDFQKLQLNNDTFWSIRHALVLLSRSKSHCDELISYFIFARNLFMETQKEHTGTGGNKVHYKFLKKCRRWLAPYTSFGTNLMYLATFHYLTGSYRKALQMCRRVLSMPNILIETEEGKKKYMQKYSGRGYTAFYKMQNAFTTFVDYGYPNGLTFCLPHLFPEVHVSHQTRMPLCIPPRYYAFFLSFLCFHDLGDTKEREETLCSIEAMEKIFWVEYTILGICYQMKGENYRAIQAYKNSMKVWPAGNPAQYRIAALKNS